MDTDTNVKPIRIDGSALVLGMTGNVGIGTTSTTAKLVVNRPQTYTLRLDGNTTTGQSYGARVRAKVRTLQTELFL